MAAWSSLLWHDTVDMIEHGTDTCKIPKSPLFIQCNASRHPIPASNSKNRNLKNPGVVLAEEVFDGLSPSDMMVRHSERGVHFSPSPNLLDKLRPSKKTSVTQKRRENYVSALISSRGNQVSYKTAVYSTKTPYARLGR